MKRETKIGLGILNEMDRIMMGPEKEYGFELEAPERADDNRDDNRNDNRDNAGVSEEADQEIDVSDILAGYKNMVFFDNYHTPIALYDFTYSEPIEGGTTYFGTVKSSALKEFENNLNSGDAGITPDLFRDRDFDRINRRLCTAMKKAFRTAIGYTGNPITNDDYYLPVYYDDTTVAFAHVSYSAVHIDAEWDDKILVNVWKSSHRYDRAVEIKTKSGAPYHWGGLLPMIHDLDIPQMTFAIQILYDDNMNIRVRWAFMPYYDESEGSEFGVDILSPVYNGYFRSVYVDTGKLCLYDDRVHTVKMNRVTI